MSHLSRENLIEVYMGLFMQVAREISDDVMLKGNVLLNNILPDTARSTIDLDLSVFSISVYSTFVKPKLVQFADKLIKEGIAARYTVKEEVTGNIAGGIKIYDENGTILYAVDVSLSKDSGFACMVYNFSGEYALGATIEKILADKILATLSQTRFRRVKDFYDLYIILHARLLYNADIIYRIMLEKKTQAEIEELFDRFPFNELILVHLEHAWEKLELYNHKLQQRIDKPPFIQVYSEVSILYDKVRKKVDEHVL